MREGICPQDTEEGDLVEKVPAGDKKSFGGLTKTFEKRVCYLAFRMTRDCDIAGELMQETFVKAYQALPSFAALTKRALEGIGSGLSTWRHDDLQRYSIGLRLTEDR